MEYKIIRHKNPKGKTTWYRAIFYDDSGRAHKSVTYHGNLATARRRAQNWLYANTHVWCNVAHIEQRINTEKGQPHIIQLGTEDII